MVANGEIASTSSEDADQEPAIRLEEDDNGWTSRIESILSTTPTLSSSDSAFPCQIKHQQTAHEHQHEAAAVDDGEESLIGSSTRSSDGTIKSGQEKIILTNPTNNRRRPRRRATVDCSCPMEILQRSYKLAADSKVAADINNNIDSSSARSSGDTTSSFSSTRRKNNCPNNRKKSAIIRRPRRRATVDCPCPMEDLMRSYKEAADSKLAADMIMADLSSAHNSGDATSTDKYSQDSSNTLKMMAMDRDRGQWRWRRRTMIDNSSLSASSSCGDETTVQSPQESSAPKMMTMITPTNNRRPRRQRRATTEEYSSPKLLPMNRRQRRRRATIDCPLVNDASSHGSIRSDGTVKFPEESIGSPSKMAMMTPTNNRRRPRRCATIDSSSSNSGDSDKTTVNFSQESSAVKMMTSMAMNSRRPRRQRRATTEENSSPTMTPIIKNKGRSRRATTDCCPCPMEVLQQSYKSAADSKVAADTMMFDDFSTSSSDVTIKSDKKDKLAVIDVSARSCDATVKSDNKAGCSSDIIPDWLYQDMKTSEDNIDASTRTVCDYEPSSPESTDKNSLFFQSFNNGTRATITTSRRASIVDPLSSPHMEHLRHGHGERTTAREKAGPRFISPLQNYHDEEDVDLNVSERTCFTSLSLESLSLSRLSESCHKSPRLPPSSPERIHDVRSMQLWEDEHQQETTTKHQHQLLEHDGIMDDELNELHTSMSNNSGQRNISGRTTPQSDTSTPSTRFYDTFARKNVCYSDEPTTDSIATATSSRGRGIYRTTTVPGGTILGEENTTTTAKSTHIGLLVRTTRNKLDESVSSLDESMCSNTTTVYPYSSKNCLAIVMDEGASFISPYCVSDFESQRETTSTTTSQTSRQYNMATSSSKRLTRSIIMRTSNDYSSGDIRDTSLPVITKSRHVVASHSYKFGDNHGPDFEQNNISERATSYPSHEATNIDRPELGLHTRRQNPRHATTDCSAIRPQQRQLPERVNYSGKGTANLHSNRQHKSEAGLQNSI